MVAVINQSRTGSGLDVGSAYRSACSLCDICCRTITSEPRSTMCPSSDINILDSTAGGKGLQSARMPKKKKSHTEPVCRCVMTENATTKQNARPSCNV